MCASSNAYHFSELSLANTIKTWIDQSMTWEMQQPIRDCEGKVSFIVRIQRATDTQWAAVTFTAL